MKLKLMALALLASVSACGDSGTTSVTCLASETPCSNLCVDLTKDVKNCGACAAACKAGEVCQSGKCAVFCQSGAISCGGACVDPKSDLQHCGAAGACSSTDSGSADYQGAKCSAGNVCAGGSCKASCLAGQVLCGGKCIDPQTDLTFCGAAGACSSTSSTSLDYQGAKCSAGNVCAGGSCKASCLAGQALCGGKCIDPQTDLTFCGAALGGACSSADSGSADYQGAKCSAGNVCAGGSCKASCLAGQVLCGGKCIDPQTDLGFCGAALGGCSSTDSSSADYQGAKCSAGNVCAAGSCKASCLAAQVLCGGKCVDPQTDLGYCGAALGGACSSTSSTSLDYQGAKCSAGNVCAAGSCKASCLATQVLCGGKCVDPQTDLGYCGAALGGACSSASSTSLDYQGAKCSAGNVCAAGGCKASCLATQVLCGGKCVDPQTDLGYCGAALGGACSSASSTSLDYQGVKCPGGNVCSAGSCKASCLATQVLCGGKCVDPQSDLGYCGAALGGACSSTSSTSLDYQGVKCPGGNVCSDGSCVLSCPSWLIQCTTKCIDPASSPTNCGATAGCGVSGGSAGVACGGGEACLLGKCVPVLCPKMGVSSLSGPYYQYGYCWYLGAGGKTCDAVCSEISGGSNQALAAQTAWPDHCNAPQADDISTYFFTHGNPGGWVGTGSTSYHTLSYGYTGQQYYGKCASGTATGHGTYPGDPNNSPTRTLVCPCVKQ